MNWRARQFGRGGRSKKNAKSRVTPEKLTMSAEDSSGQLVRDLPLPLIRGFPHSKLQQFPRSRSLGTWSADQLQSFFSQGYVSPRASLCALQGTVLK